MNPMERLQGLAERINALSLRERGLLGLAVLAVVFLLWDLFFMSGLRARHERIQSQIEQVQGQVRALTESIQQTAVAGSDDPQAALEQQRSELAAEISRLESRLSDALGEVSTPAETRSMLAELLEEHPGLELITLENLPVDRLSTTDGEPIAGVFIHRVSVVIEGRHGTVRDYLDRVSELPGGVFLETLDLSVEQWPSNRVELVFYSLTLDDRWLGV